jgi:hypothetical protein
LKPFSDIQRERGEANPSQPQNVPGALPTVARKAALTLSKRYLSLAEVYCGAGWGALVSRDPVVLLGIYGFTEFLPIAE